MSFISSGRVEWPWSYKHDHLTLGPSWGSKPVNIFIWWQQLCYVAANLKINSKTYREPVERSQMRVYVKVGSGDAALWEAREKLFMWTTKSRVAVNWSRENKSVDNLFQVRFLEQWFKFDKDFISKNSPVLFKGWGWLKFCSEVSSGWLHVSI